ncbi:hypothetical protein H1C71_028980 [Ictidomys tridecemlineatus]|nr:hypothetical protein H1C71_028980 [Ictidomys tridecemlineatus]
MVGGCQQSPAGLCAGTVLSSPPLSLLGTGIITPSQDLLRGGSRREGLGTCSGGLKAIRHRADGGHSGPFRRKTEDSVHGVLRLGVGASGRKLSDAACGRMGHLWPPLAGRT